MKILLCILVVFIGFAALILSHDNTAYGIWIRQSPQELLNDSTTIFIGNITSVNALQFGKQQTYTIQENGIDKTIVKNYTLHLDEYTVNVEEFLKNPQNTNKITVRQPTIGLPTGLGGLGGFKAGDRVLFYIKNLDGINEYSPESFIIPKSCIAKDVLTQNRLEARAESFTIQNGNKVDYSNFTANSSVQFVYNEDAGTLSGKSFDVMVSITKNTDSSSDIVFSKKIHAESKPCEWITSATWEFTPQKGEYAMAITIQEGNNTYSQSYTRFSVKSDTATPNISPLKQVHNGITTENITCPNGLELVYKASNKYPACVRHTTVEKLVQRNWAIRGQPINYFAKIDGFIIPYDLVGGNMLEIKFDTQNKSAIFSIHAPSSGILYVSIPRALLDSKSAYSNQDTKFIILVDKQEVKYTEATTITNRTLSIPYDLGAKEIEVTATTGI